MKDEREREYIKEHGAKARKALALSRAIQKKISDDKFERNPFAKKYKERNELREETRFHQHHMNKIKGNVYKPK